MTCPLCQKTLIKKGLFWVCPELVFCPISISQESGYKAFHYSLGKSTFCDFEERMIVNEFMIVNDTYNNRDRCIVWIEKPDGLRKLFEFHNHIDLSLIKDLSIPELMIKLKGYQAFS